MDKLQAIAVSSGGMDSTTLLHYLKDKGYDLYSISFYYGQRHEKELEFAKYWGEKICVDYKQIDISFMKEIADQSALMDKNIDLPQDHYTHENQKITVVPNRNMVMLSIAVAWAENLKIKEVYFGPHANDMAIYPDCRKPFVDAVSHASKLGTYSQVEIKAPFVHMEKYEIAALGAKLGVDYSKTWTCYEGLEKHCGRCATCQERKESFIKAGVSDPTEYM